MVRAQGRGGEVTRRLPRLLALALAAGALAPAALPAMAAAPGSWVEALQPVATPREPGAIALPVAGEAPASPPREGWAQQQPGQRLAYNVSQPELLPWPSSLPAGAVAPAVLLVPGGAFQFLAIDNEGFDVARRLDRLGVRVFIVKYRTALQSDSFAGFKDAVTATFVGGAPVPLSMIPAAVADTQAALRLVRARAGAWHVDPARIGLLGFSAGAITVLASTQVDAPDARPDFLGMIYGPTAASSAKVPAGAPPLFAALAADDRFFKGQDLGLIDAWRKAGSTVEFHLYSAGGHGFASHPNGTTSDAWFDQYALWLKATGVLPRRR